MIKKPKTIYGMETDCFTASKDVQDTNVMKHGAGVCLLVQTCNLACSLSGEGCNHHGKVLVTIPDKLKQQLLSRRRGKLSIIILCLQDNSGPHKAAITHQKLADLRFEILKRPAKSPDLAPQETPKGKKVLDD
jgi:hypothetical protein